MDRTAKKHMLTIPVRQHKENDPFIRVYTEGDILMLHMWNGGEFIGKYLIDKNGKYIVIVEGVQHEQKLKSAITGRYHYYAYIDDLKISKEDEKTVREFFQIQGQIDTIIERMENHYARKKRSRAYENKVERIRKYMDTFENQEKKIKDWYLQEIAPEEYAFKKDGLYYCTACGKAHVGNYKHLNQFECCGKTVTVITRTISRNRTDYITAFTRQPDGSRAERLYQVYVRCSAKGKMVDITETIRMTWIPGITLKLYYWEGGSWWDKNAHNQRWNSSYLYPENTEDILKESGYQSTRLWEIGKLKLPINWIMKHHTPVYTYLAKAGLGRLAQEDARNLDSYAYVGQLNLQGETPEEVLMLDRNSIGRLKQLNGGAVIHKWLQWKLEHPQEPLKTETLKELDEKQIAPQHLGKMLEVMTPRKCLNYIERQKPIIECMTERPIVELYNDYISMAGRMGMDLEDEIVYAPKDLKLRHDQLVEEFEKQKTKIEADEMNRKWPGAQKVLNRIREIYDYKGDGWQIITPRTLLDIVDDAHQLHHCAGASERYYERIQAEETYIMFLRRDPKTAWYTLEVEPGGTVRQKRSEYNRQPDLGIVNDYLKEWQTQIRKRLKEKDRQLAAQSAQQRAEEMSELQKGTERNRQLYDLLMADLMEAGA